MKKGHTVDELKNADEMNELAVENGLAVDTTVSMKLCDGGTVTKSQENEVLDDESGLDEEVKEDVREEDPELLVVLTEDDGWMVEAAALEPPAVPDGDLLRAK